ncbi:hypothetical protein ACFWBF_15385 [Streptomyces sp. NPDC060028]|uniref:terpene synthase family protein n=1 Tax=Streptomyces sp. NPDC060028 TaxID=3347041 RepID=UPI003692C5A4
MITQKNLVIDIPPAGTTAPPDVAGLLWCPITPAVSPDAEAARAHTLTWLTRAGIITSQSQRTYVDAMRLDLYAARVAPTLRGPSLDLFCDWIVYTTQLDDHLGTDDPDTIHPTVRRLVDVLDHDDPELACKSDDPFVLALGELWEQCQPIPQPWRRQLADGWSQWIEAYLTEATWRRDRLWPSLARYRETLRTTSAAVPFTRLSEHLAGLYLPDPVLNSSTITAMRALVPDHTMAVNDIHSARREAAAGDHLNGVFITQHEYGCTRDEAVHSLVDRANETMRHFHRLTLTLPDASTDLALNAEECGAVQTWSRLLGHWLRGNLDWHQQDTHRYHADIQPLGT